MLFLLHTMNNNTFKDGITMMKAMVLQKITRLDDNDAPLQLVNMPVPVPGKNEILIRVTACGVCHTELDEIEGRTPPETFPVVLGHQVVGIVESSGSNAMRFEKGDRVGVAWIFSSCGKCSFCVEGRENLCSEFSATGRDANGGYAEFMTVKEKFAYSIPEIFEDVQAAPLLCAGAIGYRSMMLSGMEDGHRIGLTGFGASAHLVMKMLIFRYPKTRVYVFARNQREREFALELGAVWAGDTHDPSPCKLDSIIDTTPAWKPVVEALKNLKPGGRLVINAIRKESFDKDCLLGLDYPRHLWMEKEIKSVANVTRSDVSAFLEIAAQIPIVPEVKTFSLEDANIALVELKRGRIRGAKVLVI